MPKKSTTATPTLKTSGRWRKNDPTLSWISREFPKLDLWRELALGWLNTLPRISNRTLDTLSLVISRYLVQEGLPIDPAVLLRKDTQLPDFFETACPKSAAGVSHNNTARSFLDYVIQQRFSNRTVEGEKVIDPAYHNPISKRHRLNFRTIPDRKGLWKGHDSNLVWVQQDFPQLEPWCEQATAWLKGGGRSIGVRLRALRLFLQNYLVGLGLPLDPATFLSRSMILPDFYGSVCPQAKSGIRHNNAIHEFLGFVLLRLCSEPDDHGRPVVSGAFWNPVPVLSFSGQPSRDESIHSPLSYGHIDALRRILIAGPHFRDWTWAQNATGSRTGKSGSYDLDWFPVTETEIDRDDPDCVLRLRTRTIENGGDILEMWSPVRWVALLIKLILPLRTFQVRMLDSGEADTYRYMGGEWVENLGHLRRGRPGHSWHQGVFCRTVGQDEVVTTRLYTNTNKTADIGRTGKDKGFTFPWPVLGDETGNPFYWLEKLRNWQEKYNPISRLTRWDELRSKHLGEMKSKVQLAAYCDTAFLFRDRGAKPAERHLPFQALGLTSHWYKLLKTLEDRLASQGQTLANGAPIRLVAPYKESHRGKKTFFPLHSLRVSIITALAQDGEVPPEILQKVVGHSRLLMTLYYIKLGESFIRQKMEDGLARLEAKKDSSITAWLADTEHSELLQQAICISPESVGSAIPVNPSSRNPAGWELLADGCCLMGGNTSPIEANANIGGCFNGGREFTGKKGAHGPVPGGARNCVRCRWFVTMPHHLFALQTRFDNISYREFETRMEVQARAEEHQDLENDRHDAEIAKVPFERFNELRQAMRVQEAALARWQDLILDMSACQSLLQRCAQALLEDSGLGEGGMKLLSVGSACEVQCVLEETDSELLQLSRVCEGLEVYPDLPPVREAVFRRSQLLDRALEIEGQAPLFLHLPEKVQLLAGNAWLKAMARQANPTDPELGKRKVIGLFDAQEHLLEHLGFDASECLPEGVRTIRVGESAKPTKPIQIKGRKRHALHDQHSS